MQLIVLNSRLHAGSVTELCEQPLRQLSWSTGAAVMQASRWPGRLQKRSDWQQRSNASHLNVPTWTMPAGELLPLYIYCIYVL